MAWAASAPYRNQILLEVVAELVGLAVVLHHQTRLARAATLY